METLGIMKFQYDQFLYNLVVAHSPLLAAKQTGLLIQLSNLHEFVLFSLFSVFVIDKTIRSTMPINLTRIFQKHPECGKKRNLHQHKGWAMHGAQSWLYTDDDLSTREKLGSSLIPDLDGKHKQKDGICLKTQSSSGKPSMEGHTERKKK